MYDKSLVKEIVEKILEASKTIKERCSFAKDYYDFLETKEGEEKLDSICMKLIAIGESLKQIDKITNKKLLLNYPNINWKQIKGIRDILSHHYFDLDAEIIFNICQEEIDKLIITLEKILKEL